MMRPLSSAKPESACSAGPPQHTPPAVQSHALIFLETLILVHPIPSSAANSQAQMMLTLRPRHTSGGVLATATSSGAPAAMAMPTAAPHTTATHKPSAVVRDACACTPCDCAYSLCHPLHALQGPPTHAGAAHGHKPSPHLICPADACGTCPLTSLDMQLKHCSTCKTCTSLSM